MNRILPKKRSALISIVIASVIFISLVGCSSESENRKSEHITLRPATGTLSTLGKFIPCIQVGERIFYWDGLAENTNQGEIADWRESDTTHVMTVRPVGFEFTCNLEKVSTDAPQADYEMAADFTATGEVYENPTCPEVLYVLLESKTIDNLYVRFTTDLIGNSDRIAYGGQLYKIMWDYVDALPVSFESVGQLTPIGCDNLPENDFETNASFVFGTLYASQEDSSRIYIDRINASQGDTKEYYECPVFE